MKYKKEPKVSSKILGDCVSTIESIDAYLDDIIVEVPVVLAKFILFISLSSYVMMPDGTSKIKDISNNLKITKSILMPNTNIVFIDGIINKKISYYTFLPSGVIGDTQTRKQYKINIPFECVADIIFNGDKPLPIVESSEVETNYYSNSKGGRNYYIDDSFLESDSKTRSKISNIYFNKSPYCEIIKSDIVSNNELIKNKKIHNISKPLGILELTEIRSEMVVEITMRIVQDKNVAISGDEASRKEIDKNDT
ncbi:hypothetical protein [Sporosalibacterium faouarense]|uniref:hypothetical protein n=1 Tax=Sporosalibacterium faouarense TaxID=516123 RepID=UPI00192B12E9|nr:hypothetical protein [Sporosalibacterium faouarense]